MHYHPAGRQLFGFSEITNGADVVATNHVVRRLHVHGGFVVEAIEVTAGLGEEDELNAFAGVALSKLEGTVRAIARRLVINDGALDHAAGSAFTAADDGELPAVIFADQSGDFRGADFYGTDETRLRAHGTFLKKGRSCRRREKLKLNPGGARWRVPSWSKRRLP